MKAAKVRRWTGVIAYLAVLIVPLVFLDPNEDLPHATPAPAISSEELARFVPEGTVVLQSGLRLVALPTDGPPRVLAGDLVVPALGRDPVALGTTGQQEGGRHGDEIVTVDLRSGRTAPVLRTDEDGGLSHPVAEPRGQRIAFVRSRFPPGDALPEPDSEQVCVLDLTDAQDSCVRVPRARTVEWAPDGSRILVAGTSLVSVDAGTLEVTPLLDAAYVTDLASVEYAPTHFIRASWSESGRFIAAQPNAPFPLVLTDEGEVHRFGPRSMDEFPSTAWLPGRNVLATTAMSWAGRRSQVYLLDAEAPGPPPPVRLEARDVPGSRVEGLITSLAWSPDGRWLALTLWKRGPWGDAGTNEEFLELARLRIIDVRDGRAREIRLHHDLDLDPRARLVGWTH